MISFLTQLLGSVCFGATVDSTGPNVLGPVDEGRCVLWGTVTRGSGRDFVPIHGLRGGAYASATWASAARGRVTSLAPVVYGVEPELRLGLEWHRLLFRVPSRGTVVPDHLLDSEGVRVLAYGVLAAEYALGPCNATDLDVRASVRALRGTRAVDRGPFVAILLEWAAWLGPPPGASDVAYAERAFDAAERCVARRSRCSTLFQLLQEVR
jgi:hypothetical protein